MAHICLDWNKIYQKKIAQHSVILALRRLRSTAHFQNNAAFCLAPEQNQV